MLKTNLPVLVIRDVVVFPHSEVRMEFDTFTSKNSCYRLVKRIIKKSNIGCRPKRRVRSGSRRI